MPHGDEAIESLRAALSVSPDNLPLRLHLIRRWRVTGDLTRRSGSVARRLSVPANGEIKLELATAVFSAETRTARRW